MRLLLFGILTMFLFSLHSQERKEFFVSLNYGQFYAYQASFYESQMGGGVRFNKYFDFQLGLRLIHDKTNYGDEFPSINTTEKINIVCVSVEPSFRPFKNKRVSPFIAINAGTSIYSNARGKFIGDSYLIYPGFSGATHSIYEKGLFFLRCKAQVDVRFKQFDFMLGPTFNSYYFQHTDIDPIISETQYYYELGPKIIVREGWFGFDVQLRYTFKRKEKNAMVEP